MKSLKLIAGIVAGAVMAQEVPPAAPEPKLTGQVDIGHRWVQEVIGSGRDVYRSIVNLGEGPKLFTGTAAWRSPGAKWLDRLEVTANSWGGEPYNTGRLEAGLAGAYQLRMDYRNVAYFNNLPSFADPLLGSGLFLSQRAFDLQRRSLDTELKIKPGARVEPFLAFYHGSGFGRGVSTFVVDGNEFPVSTNLNDRTQTYRGGVHFNFSKVNFTLEQGGTTFKDDQELFFSGRHYGNRSTTLFGQTIRLDDLRQAHGARGDGLFSRAAVSGRPWSRLSFTGQFQYSQPSIDVRYSEQNRGEFFLLSAIAPYTGQLERSTGTAQRPHPSGSWSTEIRPFSRLRVVQSWYTDRFHVSASSVLAQTFNTVPETSLERAITDLLVVNYHQHQVDAIIDIGSQVSLRGGHRYVWGDAVTRTPTLVSAVGPTRAGELRRQVALAGGMFRLGSRFDVTADLEASPGDVAYFRTDLMNYQRGKVQGRFKILPSLVVSAAFTVLNNRNEAPDVNLDLRSQQSSFTLYWAPNQGKRFSVTADYTRSTLRSDLPFLEPQTFSRAVSAYRDNGHHGGGWADVTLTHGVKLSLGGSYSINAGSRPTRYYQPQGRVTAPLVKKVTWTAEWRWFGFTERRYAYENFHTHVFATGLQLGL
jgi:hypothetical protein